MAWEYEEVYLQMRQEQYKQQEPLRKKAYKFIEENNCKFLTKGVYRFNDWDIYPEKIYCRNFRTNKKMSLEKFYQNMRIKK